MVRILIVDDHPLVRREIRRIIEETPGLEVVAEADNGRDGVEKAVRFFPDLVVMDVTMPLLNGMEATRQILSLAPHIKIMALSGHGSKKLVNGMKEAGATSYVIKPRAEEELIHAILETVAGRPYFSSVLIGE